MLSIYVIDEEGNWDFCETYVDVQDNMGACDNRESQLAIVGRNDYGLERQYRRRGSSDGWK